MCGVVGDVRGRGGGGGIGGRVEETEAIRLISDGLIDNQSILMS